MAILRADRTRPLEGGASFSVGNRLERLAWSIVWGLLASWTPGIFNPWRVLLLRLFGARIGTGAAIAGSALIWLPRQLELGAHSTIGPGVDCYNMAPVVIGECTIVSQRSFLCCGSHDIADPHFQLVARPIRIGSRVWIAAEAFIGPGVTIGEGCVIGARACVFGDTAAWTIYRGNPAVAAGPRRLRGAV